MGESQEERDRVYARAGFGAQTPRGTRPATVVVDFSCGFTDPAYPTGADLTAEVAAARRLVDAARQADVPVIFTTIVYEPGEDVTLAWLRKAPGLFVLQRGTELVEIDPRLAAQPDEPILEKKGASAFYGTDLESRLRALGVDTVLLAGATTSGCIRASAVDAVQGNFAVLVVRDAVGDRAAGPHEANLFDIEAKYGDVIGIDDALDYITSVGARTA